METIEIQCGSCNQTMAVLAEHLGTQVHCPHCQSIVQTPAASDYSSEQPPVEEAPLAEADPRILAPEHGESIFAEPERDDLFGTESPQPRVEMPEPDAPMAAMPLEVGFAEERAPNLSLDEPRAEPVYAETDSPVEARAETREAFSPASDLGMEDEVAMRGPAFKPRKRSLLVPTLLIFLIPYSILATVFSVMLVLNQTRNLPEDPMQRIPDPDPNPKGKKGPPRKLTRRSHDAPLPPHLITRLRRPVRVGDIEVTPLDVALTEKGVLSLRLRAKNLAQNHAFVPISQTFLDVHEQAEVAKPHTFVHAKAKDLMPRIYGGYLEYQDDTGEPELGLDGELLPGQAGIVQISTMPKFSDDGIRLLNSTERYTWRVQVRRGLVEVAGEPEPRSATAVIGIDFRRDEIIDRTRKPRES